MATNGGEAEILRAREAVIALLDGVSATATTIVQRAGGNGAEVWVGHCEEAVQVGLTFVCATLYRFVLATPVAAINRARVVVVAEQWVERTTM